MLDMGIEGFNVSSAVNLSHPHDLVQTLVELADETGILLFFF